MTEILKAKPTPQVKVPKANAPKAGGTKPEPVWPEIFDVDRAKELFTPVEDLAALMALYRLWRIGETGRGDPSQVQALKALIEHRTGRPFAKSPVGASSVEGVEIEYIDPYDLPEGEAGEE